MKAGNAETLAGWLGKFVKAGVEEIILRVAGEDVGGQVEGIAKKVVTRIRLRIGA